MKYYLNIPSYYDILDSNDEFNDFLISLDPKTPLRSSPVNEGFWSQLIRGNLNFGRSLVLAVGTIKH